jgi:hypothetical protein
MAHRFDMDEGSRRGQWHFRYQADDLLEPAATRLGYHRARLGYWQKEAARVEGEIRAKGVRLEELPVTGGSRFEARIDHSLGSRLTECRAKVERHLDLCQQYEAYIAEFEREPAKEYQLGIGDLRFFGLVGEPEPDKE